MSGTSPAHRAAMRASWKNPVHREHRRVGLIAGWDNLERRAAQAKVTHLRWVKLWREEWRDEMSEAAALVRNDGP